MLCNLTKTHNVGRRKVLAHHFCPSAGGEIWRILAYFFPPIHHTEGTWQHITPQSTTAKLCNHVWTDFSEFYPDCLKSASSKYKKNEYIHIKWVQACQSVINLSVNCKIQPAVTWMYVACAFNVVLILQSICHPLCVRALGNTLSCWAQWTSLCGACRQAPFEMNIFSR